MGDKRKLVHFVDADGQPVKLFVTPGQKVIHPNVFYLGVVKVNRPLFRSQVWVSGQSKAPGRDGQANTLVDTAIHLRGGMGRKEHVQATQRMTGADQICGRGARAASVSKEILVKDRVHRPGGWPARHGLAGSEEGNMGK